MIVFKLKPGQISSHESDELTRINLVFLLYKNVKKYII